LIILQAAFHARACPIFIVFAFTVGATEIKDHHSAEVLSLLLRHSLEVLIGSVMNADNNVENVVDQLEQALVRVVGVGVQERNGDQLPVKRVHEAEERLHYGDQIEFAAADYQDGFLFRDQCCEHVHDVFRRKELEEAVVVNFVLKRKRVLGRNAKLNGVAGLPVVLQIF